ncbi:hypothetical protein [Lactiplantibacillus plantarum]|jgi:orotidine-5'-phosphate decarboxylase|uniref:hypothetical protein n=1 Tax=Lactiplantibacillus plantarum TaxID=1590 RepID=UPI00034E6EF9|nr:hypothetical protein [Lactiplantibacillus plantarum]EPD25117.1 hypothetical protein L103_04322 [Lactiplantibacillus plantarum IPLA88]RCI89202.1 hypothetical protein DT256_12265 [Lactiplantibacillus plantarum]
MSKALDIPTMKQRLAQAEQELASKIGHDMVTKQGIETFSAYQKFMRTAKTADKPALPAELQVQAQQFQQQLEEWTVDNWGNKIDYKTFYPELLTFFRQLNNVEKPR